MGLKRESLRAAPEHLVSIAAFCVDRREVSVADYDGCVRARACLAPFTEADDDADQPPHHDASCSARHPERTAHPVSCVDWRMADQYCRYVGGRLPSEEEWEYAARGTDGRLYPWGNDPPDERRVNDSAPVGTNPTGASPFGALDLADNVSEWTSTPWRAQGEPPPDADTYVARGGCWANQSPAEFTAVVRVAARANMHDSCLGIRCVYPVEPP
jgi:formylglycine-generating enzyme required for sulfatase activity